MVKRHSATVPVHKKWTIQSETENKTGDCNSRDHFLKRKAPTNNMFVEKRV